MKKLSLLVLSSLFVVSCSVESVDGSRNGSDAQNTNTVAVVANDPNNNGTIDNTVAPTSAFMFANVNGVDADFKPLGFPTTNPFETTVESYKYQDVKYSYLLLQGTSTTNVILNPGQNPIQIDLRIPKIQWAVGTYPIQDMKNAVVDGKTSYVTFAENKTNMSTKSVYGSLTITEFNMATKRIKGTFSFEYTNDNNGVEEGPYNVTNGTFDYKLDAPFFQ